MTPEELAARRLDAIAQLQEQLSGHVDEAQRRLLEGLLLRLQDIQADPTTLTALLADYQATVALPLAVYYAQSLLTLPELQASYFEGLGVAGYNKLRAPLADYLTARLGITAEGLPVAGGYLSTLVGDTTVQRALLQYAYSAQAAGVGLADYRAGLRQLVVGGNTGKGLMQQLYQQSYDDFNRADRVLQKISADRLGLQAYLYQGGLIDSSRPFCKVRNGKCFTSEEVAKFGTKEDAYGGYTNKAQGLFAGKSEPYAPFEDCGGWNCKHGLHAVANVVALRMRPDLAESEKGQLYIK